MTNSFQSTAFQSSARPVDTFVRPPSVQPKTSAEELYTALATINPGLQRFIGTKIEDAIEDERADITMEIAKKGFKQIVKEHREKYGDNAANQLIGGSIFTQDEFDKRQAQNVGLNLKTDFVNLYNNKTFTFTDRNQNEVTKPITHFGIDTPQYQEFIQDVSSLTTEKTQGLSNKYLAKEFYPYQQKAIQQITTEHIKQNNEHKLEQYTSKLQGIIFSNWREYDEGNQQQALANIQDMIESSVDLGLANTVTPTELLKIAKNQASRIFDIEQSSGGNGYTAAKKYLDMIGKLRTGPQQLQKDGSFKQRQLSESFGTDILKFKTQLADSFEKFKKLERERVQAAEEFNIERFVKQFATKNDALEELLKANPERREFIFDQIEIYSGNRNDLFDDFNYKVGIGYYANNPVKKFSDLAAIKAQIGATFTDEDRKNYDRSFNIAKSGSGNTIGKYDTRIQRMHTDAKQRLGNTGIDLNTFEKKENIGPYLDLKGRIDRRVIDEVINEPGLTPDQREAKFREIQADYFSNIKAIKTGNYEDVGTFDTEEEKEKRLENKKRKDAIQKLSEDYGLSMKNATEIYDEDQVERFTENTVPQGSFNITPQEQGEKTQVQTETKPKVETKEDGFLELLFDQIGNLIKGQNNVNEEEKNNLVTQLNNIRENVGEVSSEVVNSFINTLSGPPAIAGESPSVLDDINIAEPFVYNQLEKLAVEGGFTPEQAKIMAAIALAESSGRARALNDDRETGDLSYGLWQINMIDYPDYKLGEERRGKLKLTNNDELYNPAVNVRAAKMIFDEQGYDAWSVYKTGAYKKFLPKTN